MKKASRWGMVITVVCGAELVVLAIVGGAGVAVLLRPDALLLIGLATVLAIGALIRRRKAGAGRPSHVTEGAIR